MPAKKVNTVQDVIWGNKSVENNARLLPPPRGPSSTDPEWNELVDTVQDPALGHAHSGAASDGKQIAPGSLNPPAAANPHGDAQHTPLYIETLSVGGGIQGSTFRTLDVGTSAGTVQANFLDASPTGSVLLDIVTGAATVNVSAVKNRAGVQGTSLFPSAADHGHALALDVKSKTANYTMTTNDCIIRGTGGAGGITITLPAATFFGMMVLVKKIDTGAGAVTVARAGADTIEGATSLSLATQWNGAHLVADGVSTWLKLTTL